MWRGSGQLGTVRLLSWKPLWVEFLLLVLRSEALRLKYFWKRSWFLLGFIVWAWSVSFDGENTRIAPTLQWEKAQKWETESIINSNTREEEGAGSFLLPPVDHMAGFPGRKKAIQNLTFSEKNLFLCSGFCCIEEVWWGFLWFWGGFWHRKGVVFLSPSRSSGLIEN